MTNKAEPGQVERLGYTYRQAGRDPVVGSFETLQRRANCPQCKQKHILAIPNVIAYKPVEASLTIDVLHTPPPVPEPATFSLAVLGAAGLWFMRRFSVRTRHS